MNVLNLKVSRYSMEEELDWYEYRGMKLYRGHEVRREFAITPEIAA